MKYLRSTQKRILQVEGVGNNVELAGPVEFKLNGCMCVAELCRSDTIPSSRLCGADESLLAPARISTHWRKHSLAVTTAGRLTRSSSGVTERNSNRAQKLQHVGAPGMTLSAEDTWWLNLASEV
jgi:hypothetical protein